MAMIRLQEDVSLQPWSEIISETLLILVLIVMIQNISDLGPPQVSSKFASSRDGPRGGGGGGDRMGGGGGRYDNRAPAYDSRAPAYDRGGYQGGGSRDDRGGGGYGGGSGYDRAPPMYRDDRIGGGREIPRYERGRSPPAAAYYDERRGGGAYDER